MNTECYNLNENNIKSQQNTSDLYIKYSNVIDVESELKRINLYNNGKYNSFRIHRLVAIHYIRNDNDSLVVDHIDKDKNNKKKMYKSKRFNQVFSLRDQRDH